MNNFISAGIMIPALALFIAGCQSGESRTPADQQPESKHAIGAVSSVPNLTVSDETTVYLSWIEPVDSSSHVLKFATMTSTGWTDARTIASGPNWFVNWADVPSLTADGQNLTAHWLQRNGTSTYAYGIRVSSSTDGGASWSEPQWLHEDMSASEHGFAALNSTGTGVRAVWLDGRKYGNGVHEMTLMSRLIQPDGSMTSEATLDELVCDCCPVSSVLAQDGRLLVAYRNRTKSEIRDINTVVFDGSEWSNPIPVYADGWEIAGCPVNGPAVDVYGTRSAVAWFTGANDSARVNVAFGSLDNESYSQPVRIDAGRPVGRVDVQMPDSDSAIVLWIENGETAESANLLLRRVDASGSSEPVRIASISPKRSSGFPKMVSDGQQLILAWTDVSDDPNVITTRIPLDSFH